MLEKYALLKMASCRAPVLSSVFRSISALGRSFSSASEADGEPDSTAVTRASLPASSMDDTAPRDVGLCAGAHKATALRCLHRSSDSAGSPRSAAITERQCDYFSSRWDVGPTLGRRLCL